METKKSGYSSRFALICVLIGGSVGTGNLWRFPRLVANTGGAAFIIVMTVCVFLTALPLLYVENFMGRATRHSAPGAFHDICGKKYTCLGMFATLAYLLMLAYYLVVLAWCLRYAGMSLTGGYFGVDKEALFTSVTTADPATIGVWVVALVLVYFGIAKQEALEKVSSILMPCLFGLLIGLVVYALTRKGAYDGLKYSFTLNPKSLVDINIWKEALTQVAWSIGPGTMMMITAAMVSHKDGDITLNSHVQAFGDMTVALLGTVCVLPIIFANALSPEAASEICASGNNGLTFMALTEMFEGMAGGRFVGCAHANLLQRGLHPFQPFFQLGRQGHALLIKLHQLLQRQLRLLHLGGHCFQLLQFFLKRSRFLDRSRGHILPVLSMGSTFGFHRLYPGQQTAVLQHQPHSIARRRVGSTFQQPTVLQRHGVAPAQGLLRPGGTKPCLRMTEPRFRLLQSLGCGAVQPLPNVFQP